MWSNTTDIFLQVVYNNICSWFFARYRSGSESKGVGAVAKVMDMFRTRSQSMSLTPEAKAKVSLGLVAMRRFVLN